MCSSRGRTDIALSWSSSFSLCSVARVFFFLVLGCSPALLVVHASFDRDVIQASLLLKSRRQQPSKGTAAATLSTRMTALDTEKEAIHSAILSKAVPLDQYYSMLNNNRKDGTTVVVDGSEIDNIQQHRKLEDQEQDDDFNVNYNDMYSFSGYSLKYAKCQPIQYFSEDAIYAGEHSPMRTEEIVILRLCPEASCGVSSASNALKSASDSSSGSSITGSAGAYGCHYNYAEYGISVADYVSIMLRYTAKKHNYMCDWCDKCIANANYYDDYYNRRQRRNRRRLEQDENNQEEQEEDDQGEDGGNDDQDGDDAAANGDDAAAANGDDAVAEEAGYYYDEDDDDDDAYANACSGFDTYCSEYKTYCLNNDDDSYIDYDGYLDYLECSEVDYNGHAYFVRPRCDGYKDTIKMAVYYDQYCAQYAGNEVSIKDLGLGFRESLFEEFYKGDCIDCSEDDNYPPYDATSILCNKIHAGSARCTTDLLYDLFDGQEDDSTECSFIESIRFGTYDEEGKLSTTVTNDIWTAEVTTTQKAFLVISIMVCVLLIMYACYLHHSMTNLLIKSLSHRELLPPSRQSRRRSPASARRGSTSSKRGGSGGGSDNEDGGTWKQGVSA